MRLYLENGMRFDQSYYLMTVGSVMNSASPNFDTVNY